MKNTKKTRRRFGTVLERTLPSGAVVYTARWSEGRAGPRRERAFRTHKEAIGFLTDLEKKILLGQYQTPPTAAEVAPQIPQAPVPSPTFVAYAEEVLDTVIAPTRAPATTVLYRANLRALRRFFGRRRSTGGSVPAASLDAITPSAFHRYRAWRKSHASSGPKGRGVGNATLNRDQCFARLVLNHAVTDGLLEKNPLSGLRELSEPRHARRWLSRVEAEKLLESCDAWYRPFVLAGLLTGARGGELRALTWGDVHFDAGKIDISRSKVGSSDSLDLHPNLAKILQEIKASRPQARDKDHVFLNRYGRPWKDMRRAWDRAVKAAGLEGRDGLSPHSLRHTFATFFLADGGAVTDLQAQLGHTQLTTTRIYADLVDERRRMTVLSLPFGDPQDPDKRSAQGGTQGGTEHSGPIVRETPSDEAAA